MSKQSIRDQIQQAKDDLNNALGAGSTPELKAAIKSLLIVVDILVSLFLEKKIRKNSSNSGLPPSKDPASKNDRNKPTNKERSKLGEQIDNTREVQTKEIVGPDYCNNCDSDLKNVKVSDSEDRKKIDIVYEVITHTVTAEVKICPECGIQNKGKFPKGMEGKIQYGIGVKATVINFLCVQMSSLERTQEYLKGIVGRLISQAVLLKYIFQLYEALEDWELSMIDKLLKSHHIHVDETSTKVDKKNYWAHSYSAADITLKFIHENRGSEAIDEIGIIPRYGGVIIHDCYASYFKYENVEHALCGGHLLRELKFVEESTGDHWARSMKKILQQAAETVGNRPKLRILKEKEYKQLQSRYRNILTRALKELPEFPIANGRRGRLKHTDAQNLWMRLKKHETSILRFARDKNIDFTNNRAERDIRISKVKQKVSGCFRTLKYAQCFYRISSYLKTMRYKGYSSMQAIMLAYQGNIPI